VLSNADRKRYRSFLLAELDAHEIAILQHHIKLAMIDGERKNANTYNNTKFFGQVRTLLERTGTMSISKHYFDWLQDDKIKAPSEAYGNKSKVGTV
jgi:hypothetical protein